MNASNRSQLARRIGEHLGARRHDRSVATCPSALRGCSGINVEAANEGGPHANSYRLSVGSACRKRAAIYSRPRNRAHAIIAIRWFGNLRTTTGNSLGLFNSQGLAHAFRFTQRILNVFVGRSVFEEDHALAAWTLPGISASDPARLVSEGRFTSRTAYLNGVINSHCLHPGLFVQATEYRRNPAGGLRPAHESGHAK